MNFKICLHCGAKQWIINVCKKHSLPFCWKCGKHLVDPKKECDED